MNDKFRVNCCSAAGTILYYVNNDREVVAWNPETRKFFKTTEVKRVYLMDQEMAESVCEDFNKPLYKIERISNFGNDGYIVRHKEFGFLKYIDNTGGLKWVWALYQWGNAYIFENEDSARYRAEKMLA